MRGLLAGTCDRALAPGGGAPEWVHLLPEGQIKARDGRYFELADPGALVLAFQAGGIDLPIDYEHQNDKPEAKLSGPVPAAGWIKELKAAEGGIWGRVEWTATAAEMIGRKEYRFLSPSILFHARTRQIAKLKGAGLVHNPALFLTALASQETNPMPPNDPENPAALDLAAELVRLFKLPPETSAAQILAQVAELLKATPDPAKYVPVAAARELLSERLQERQTTSEIRVKARIEDALRKGYLAGGAMREWATALCRSDEGAFDAFLESSGPLYADLLKTSHAAKAFPAHLAQATIASNGSDLEAAICTQLGLKPGALNT